MNGSECLLGSRSPLLSTEADKLSNTDEDLESGVGVSSSDEENYSSQDDETKEEKNSSSLYTLNDSLKINVSGREQWLCLARLPLDLEEEEFVNLCSEFGGMKRYHLIRSDLTGNFKGYGLVEYNGKSSSIQAKHILDGHKLRGHTLEADWLTPDRIQETSLHSKCLFVDRLPSDYRDMGEFRKLFSSVINPPYCQIAMKNGVIQNWGLVEFQRSQDAEETLLVMNGYEILPGSKIRVQYCIPGVHAINVYMSFVNNPMDAISEKKALLEETPSTKVYDQLESLSKQNPWFVQSLQNIMAMNNSSEGFPKDPPPQPPASKGGGDPAQAALILLLASSVVRSKENKSNNSIASLLSSVIKRLETGVSASEILKTFLPSSSESDLRSFITDLLVKNDSSQKKKEIHPPPIHGYFGGSTSSSGASHSPSSQQTKDPTLTDLLLQSFQARVNKGKCSRSSPTPSQMSKNRGPPKTAHSLHKSPPTQSTPKGPPTLLTQFNSAAPNVYPSNAAGGSAYALYAAPQIQTYRPGNHQPSQLFSHHNPAASFYPGLWPSQMSFPLLSTPAQWAATLPLLNTTALEGGPYLTGAAVAYPAAAPPIPKRKLEIPQQQQHHHHLYGESLQKKVKLNEGL